MMAWIWQLIAGCVTIQLEGLKLLELVNRAVSAGIPLDNVRRLSYSKMTATTTWRGYARLCAMAAKEPLRVKLLGQWGLPVVLGRARKRVAFVLGLGLCLAALVLVNAYVLQVCVIGSSDAALAGQIETFLAEQGVHPGVGKWTLNLPETETRLMLRFPQVTFASIRVRGVRATVEVAEGDPAPELVDRSQPANVTASRDAVVRTVTVYEGQAAVQPGDVVRAGELLVSGVVEELEHVRQVHARAEVLASVWAEGRGDAPLWQENSVRTGRSVRRWDLTVGPWCWPLGGQDASFARYDTQVREYYLPGWGEKGPKLVVTETLDVLRLVQERDPQTVREEVLAQAAAQAAEALPADANVVERRVVYAVHDGTLTARVYLETLVNIAQETPMK